MPAAAKRVRTRAAVTDGAVSFQQCFGLPGAPFFSWAARRHLSFFRRGAERNMGRPVSLPHRGSPEQTGAHVRSLRGL